MIGRVMIGRVMIGRVMLGRVMIRDVNDHKCSSIIKVQYRNDSISKRNENVQKGRGLIEERIKTIMWTMFSSKININVFKKN